MPPFAPHRPHRPSARPASVLLLVAGLLGILLATPVAAQSSALGEACPKPLVLSDVRTAPDAQEYIDLTNVGPRPLLLEHCVVGGFTSVAYLALVPSGMLAPGATFRFGASGVESANAPLPDGALEDEFAALALLNLDTLPLGTQTGAVVDAIRTSLVYTSGSSGLPSLFGFFHVLIGGAAEYCTYYADRLTDYSKSQCATFITISPRPGPSAPASLSRAEHVRMLESVEALRREANGGSKRSRGLRKDTSDR